MAEHHRVFNVAHRLAMVVDHRHMAAPLVDFPAFQQVGQVGVHHHQQGILGDGVQHVLRFGEVIPETGIPEPAQQRSGQGGPAAHRDDGGHIHDLADPQHADGRAHAVQIAHLVAHDDDAVALADHISQGGGQDAVLDLAALFNTAGYPAVEFKSVPCLDGHLVAAPAQGHIQGLLGHFLTFRQGGPAPAHAGGQGDGLAVVQRADLVQQAELTGHHLLHMPLFHHGDIAACAQAAQETGGLTEILLQRAVDPLHQAGFLRVLHAVEEDVVAVHLQQHIGRAAGGVLGGGGPQFGQFHQEHHPHAAFLRRAGGICVETALPYRQILPLGAGGGGQIQAGQQLLHRRQQTAGADRLLKAGVAPEHRPALQHQRGQRHGGQRSLYAAGRGYLAAQVPGHPAAQTARAEGGQYQNQHQRQPCRDQQQRLHKDQHRQQRGAECGQHRQQDLQLKSGIAFHGFLLSTAADGRRITAHRARRQFTLPSEWAGSSGCAWSCGRYRR